MKKLLSLISLICAINIICAQNSWQQKSTPPFTIRICPMSFSSDQSGYVTTGFDTNYHVLYDNWKYNSTSDTWAQQTNINFGAKAGGSSFTVAGRSFCGFGFLSNGAVTKDLWELDTATGAWTQKSSCPGSARSLANSFVINDKAYITCGTQSSSNTNLLNDCWEYDVSTNIWAPRSDYPGQQRIWPVSFVVDGLAYVGTGIDMTDSLLSDFYSYNNVTDSWTRISDFPSARVGGAGFTLRNTGYVGFGDNGNVKCNDLWYYDKAADTWNIAAALPAAGRDQAYGFVINDKFYVCGGQNDQDQYFNDLWEYSPDTTLGIEDNKSNPGISISRNGSQIILLLRDMCLPADLILFDMNGQNIFNQTILSENEIYTETKLRNQDLFYMITDKKNHVYKGRIQIVQ